jgi:hypothetical protein
MRRIAAFLLAFPFLASVAAWAGDPVFAIEFENSEIRPAEIVVPANSRFKLELRNVGTSPIEFESLELRKEKVIGPGVTTFIVFNRLSPGEYSFFDDFHPDTPPARLVVVEDKTE